MKKLAIALVGLSSVVGTQAFAELIDHSSPSTSTQPTAQATQHSAQQSAQSTQPTSSKSVKQASANYQCDQGNQVTVNYAFNQSGLPTQASFDANGTAKQLQLDPAQSNKEEIVFNSKEGYSLSASAPTSDNPVFAKAVTINGPSSATTYQNCQAVSQGE